MDAQRAGVDVVVVGVRRNPLQGIGCWRGRYRIDEKDRRFNPDGTLAKDYGDMFVECAMDYGDRTQLGWSLDPKKVTDLVVYATVRHVTLIHYRLYRAFCREEIPRWRKSVRRTRSRRGDSSWTTYHASVGWRELARHATCVQWAWSPPAWTIEQRVGLTT